MKLTRKRLHRAILRSLFVGVVPSIDDVADDDDRPLHLSWYIAFGEHGEWLDYGYSHRRKQAKRSGKEAARDYADMLANLLIENMGENDE